MGMRGLGERTDLVGADGHWFPAAFSAATLPVSFQHTTSSHTNKPHTTSMSLDTECIVRAPTKLSVVAVALATMLAHDA